MTLLADTRKANDNVALEDDLVRKIGAIESQTIAWMAQATTLHDSVDDADKASILAHRAELIARLKIALGI